VTSVRSKVAGKKPSGRSQNKILTISEKSAERRDAEIGWRIRKTKHVGRFQKKEEKKAKISPGVQWEKKSKKGAPVA